MKTRQFWSSRVDNLPPTHAGRSRFFPVRRTSAAREHAHDDHAPPIVPLQCCRESSDDDSSSSEEARRKRRVRSTCSRRMHGTRTLPKSVHRAISGLAARRGQSRTRNRRTKSAKLRSPSRRRTGRRRNPKKRRLPRRLPLRNSQRVGCVLIPRASNTTWA